MSTVTLKGRIIRHELDRLAGEIVRRHAETDVCIGLFARREALRAVRSTPDLVRWLCS